MKIEDSEDPILDALDRDEEEDGDWDLPEHDLDGEDDKDDEDAQFRTAVDGG
tara:strand:- start:29 stop:184 length:156 start_codon:yes stop_codon:yes gene_type:complete